MPIADGSVHGGRELGVRQCIAESRVLARKSLRMED